MPARRKVRPRSRVVDRMLARHEQRCHWCNCRLVRLASLAEDQIRILGHHFVVWKTNEGKLDQALIASVDHLLPRSRGGHNGQENLVPACKFCNEARKNKTPEALLEVDAREEFSGAPVHSAGC